MSTDQHVAFGYSVMHLIARVAIGGTQFWNRTSTTSCGSWLALAGRERQPGVDLFDVPYLALAFDLDCPLWTGDKKLIKGLLDRGVDQALSTEDVLKFL